MCIYASLGLLTSFQKCVFVESFDGVKYSCPFIGLDPSDHPPKFVYHCAFRESRLGKFWSFDADNCHH